MSQRGVTGWLTAGLGALTANSVAAYVIGERPAIFDGPTFWVLLAAWVVCLGTWIAAVREHRRSIRESTEDLELQLTVSRWRLAQKSQRSD